MRIVNAPPATTRRWSAGDAPERAARFERLGLAVTSLVLLFGLWLTYVEQTATFSTFEADVKNGALVNLNSIRDESALPPQLTTLTKRAEEGITHVGALASLAALGRAGIARLKPALVVGARAQVLRLIEVGVVVLML